jgi:hypothetical protein
MAQVLADLSSLQNTVRRPPLSSTSSYTSVGPTSRASSPPTPTSAPQNTPSTNPPHSSSSQDPAAASALVGANKQAPEMHVRRRSKGFLPEPPQFDKLGRRRLTTKSPSYNNGTRSPIPIGLPRMGSSFSSLPSSGAATPTSNNEPVSFPRVIGTGILIQLLILEIAR